MDENRNFNYPGPNSWLSPKLEIRQEDTIEGKGMFARQSLKEGELIAIWGGDVVPTKEWRKLSEEQRRQSAQVEEGFYLVSNKPGPGDYINHCCDPNAGLDGQIVIRAMKDIEAGEEVCIDYAMTDGTAAEEFKCACGSPKCRKIITGDDWKNPDLQQRYKGYFSPFLQKRIDEQN
ncbi:MAG: SET domain-containing protein [Anaerolineales bacterium]